VSLSRGQRSRRYGRSEPKTPGWSAIRKLTHYQTLVALLVMKKSTSADGRTKKRGAGPPQTFDEYVATAPQPARAMLRKMRSIIRSAAPRRATETISYRIPAFRHKGILVWFAAFSDHCSLFPTASVIAEFRSELKNFSTSKGTVHFPLDKPLPVALIKKMVRARVAQTQAQKKS